MMGRYFLRAEVAALGLHVPTIPGIYSTVSADLPSGCPVVRVCLR